MDTRYSISEARNNLPRLIRRVERGAHAEIMRRGKPVAVLLSSEEYERMSGERKNLWEAILGFRENHDLTDLNIEEVYKNVRDRSPGRESTL